jgi:tRNA(Ile)-lysidine synthase
VRAAVSDLAPGDLVLVACSGGADSFALAAALAFEAPRAGLAAGALTVDHGLQQGSADRAGELAMTLRGLGLDPTEVLTVTVGAAGGPEAAARAARYAALAAAADRLAAAAVVLGHTRDDQAETVLLGLARGSGARSLAGMAAVTGRWRRPLLGLDRATTRRAAAGLPVWEDPHNTDPAYARSRVRRDALPALEAALGPGVAAALARSADLLRADADALDVWAASAYAACGGGDGLDVPALEALPAAVRSRVLRRAALEAGAPAGDLTAGHVGELERLLRDWHGQGPLHLPGGVRVERRCGRLLLTRGQ